MTRLNIGQYRVRIWRTCASLEQAATDLLDDAPRLLQQRLWLSDAVTIAAALEMLPRVAAYEVLNALGDGVVVYPDWQ